MARPPRPRRIRGTPAARYFKPQGIPLRELSEQVLSLEGLEALRLVDFLGQAQEEAAEHMDISKATLCRVLAKARSTVAAALVQGCALRIDGGDYRLDTPEETACPGKA